MSSRKGFYAMFRFALVHSMLFFVGVQASGGVGDMSRLLSTLLTNYSNIVLPQHNRSSPLHVQLGIAIMAVVNLDTRSQILHLRGYVKVSWTDILLGWDPEEYGNISYVILPQKHIWKPDMTMGNSLLDNIYVGSEETRLYINHRGLVSWQPVFTSDFKCEVDVTRYPMDVNTCTIVINSWMYDNSYVKLSVMEPHTVLENTIFNGQFTIEIAEPLAFSKAYDGLEYDFVHFRVRLLRRPSYTFLSMLLPMFVIGLLNIVSFLIPSDNSEKVSLSLNILLATAVFIGVVHDDLPDRSDTISSVAIYVIFLLVLAFLGVLGNTLVLLLHEHDQATHEHQRDSNTSRHHHHNNSNSNSLEPSPETQRPHSTFLGNASTDNQNVFLVACKNPPSRGKNKGTEGTNAHVHIQETPSRAARLNRGLLVTSVIFLFGCTAVVLLLIVS